MSHQRHLSHDPIKEPHSISLKVLRLSRPSLVTQYPVPPPPTPSTSQQQPAPIPASLAYTSASPATNTDPFLLSPILNLPPSFGSAYVGEHFSCTLCANHEPPDASAPTAKQIRDVRIEAEMKTPGTSGTIHKLSLTAAAGAEADAPTDLSPSQTLQRVVGFDLKDEGNHVLAVTVSYHESTPSGGRTRTFRKLYQFICKASLVVRTKVGALPDGAAGAGRWVLEAQLENCSDEVMLLDKVLLDLEPGLGYEDCNWGKGRPPVLHPGEVEQVCFVVEGGGAPAEDGRVVFGVLGIGWRGEMGNRGFLSTGRLGTRAAVKA